MKTRCLSGLGVAFGLSFAAGFFVQDQAAYAQQLNAPVINRQGAIAGTANSAVGAAPGSTRSPSVLGGFGHIGAGTGGLQLGVGNVTGGTQAGALGVGSGGVADNYSWGSTTGGLSGDGRGLVVGAGGLNDRVNAGINTGGVNGSAVGAGTGGIADLNGYGSGTGGYNEFNAVRYRVGQ